MKPRHPHHAHCQRCFFKTGLDLSGWDAGGSMSKQLIPGAVTYLKGLGYEYCHCHGFATAHDVDDVHGCCDCHSIICRFWISAISIAIVVVITDYCLLATITRVCACTWFSSCIPAFCSSVDPNAYSCNWCCCRCGVGSVIITIGITITAGS